MCAPSDVQPHRNITHHPPQAHALHATCAVCATTSFSLACVRHTLLRKLCACNCPGNPTLMHCQWLCMSTSPLSLQVRG